MPPAGVKIVPKYTEEELRFQKQIEAEKDLVSLRREYEILDRESVRYQLTGYGKQSKAFKVFNIFKQEYENILKNLAVATAPAKLKEDSIQFRTVSDLLQENEIYNEEVKTQKKYMVELEEQIKKVAKNVYALEQQQISDRQHEAIVHAARKTLETLENKLDVEMKKFNIIVAQNVRLRNEIDHLLWNRRNFMTLWEKLIDRLTSGKRIMLDLIEQASIAYDQREDCCNKLQVLRMSGHKNYIINMEEMRRYRQSKDNTQKLDEFFSIKGQKRVVKDLIEKAALKRTEQKIKMGKKLHEYKSMVMEIEEFTLQTDVQVIAKKYHQSERENFSKFMFVINAMNDMELVNDTLASLHEDIEKERIIHKGMVKQQRNTIENLEKEYKKATEDNKRVEEDIHQIDDKLNVLMQDTVRLFKLCQCQNDTLLNLLGDQTTIKEYNVLLYLEILENTIYGHLLKASYKTKFDKKSSKHIFSEDLAPPKIYSIDRIVTADPCALCLEHEMVSDVVETAQPVWRREEVKKRLQQRISAPDGDMFLHRLSKCHLPAARRILQLRYT